MNPNVIKRFSIAALFILASAGLSYGINHYFQERYRKISPAPDTTYYSSPAFPDGYVDFTSALNAHFSRGVTPANNAAIPLYLATDPSQNLIGWKLDALRGGLGVKDLPDPQTTFIDFVAFMTRMKPPDTGPNSQVFHENQKESADIWSEQIDSRSRAPWTRAQDPDAYAWLQRNEPARQLILQASERDHFFHPLIVRPGTGSVMHATLPSLGVMRGFNDLLATHALFSIANHDFAAWRTDVLAQQRLGRLLIYAPTVVQSLVGIAILSRANDTILASLDALSADQVSTIIADIRTLPPPSDIADTLDQGERINTLAEISMMARFGPTVESVSFDDPSIPLPAPASLGFQAPIDFPSLLREHNRLIDRYVAASRLPTYSARRAAFDAIIADCRAITASAPDKSTTNAIRMLIFMPPAIIRASELQDRLRQQSRMTQLALILTAYRREHNTYPPQLSALANGEHITADLFADDAPLHYVPSTATIYSIGLNARDDNGIYNPPKSKVSFTTLVNSSSAPRPDFPDDIAIQLPR